MVKCIRRYDKIEEVILERKLLHARLLKTYIAITRNVSLRNLQHRG